MADESKTAAERLASLLDRHKRDPMALVPHMAEIAEGVMDAVKRIEALEGARFGTGTGLRARRSPDEPAPSPMHAPAAGGAAVAAGFMSTDAPVGQTFHEPMPVGDEGKPAGHHPGKPRTHHLSERGPSGEGEA
jgi:hypothetical protein